MPKSQQLSATQTRVLVAAYRGQLVKLLYGRGYVIADGSRRKATVKAPTIAALWNQGLIKQTDDLHPHFRGTLMRTTLPGDLVAEDLDETPED